SVVAARTFGREALLEVQAPESPRQLDEVSRGEDFRSAPEIEAGVLFDLLDAGGVDAECIAEDLLELLPALAEGEAGEVPQGDLFVRGERWRVVWHDADDGRFDVGRGSEGVSRHLQHPLNRCQRLNPDG